jgi:hypothetical protein
MGICIRGLLPKDPPEDPSASGISQVKPLCLRHLPTLREGFAYKGETGGPTLPLLMASPHSARRLRLVKGGQNTGRFSLSSIRGNVFHAIKNGYYS